MELTTRPKRLSWRLVFFIVLLAGTSLNYAKSKSEERWDSPLKPRTKLINTLQEESVLTLVENLPHFDDTVWVMGSMNTGTAWPQHSYVYLKDYVPRLNRIRKILTEWKRHPAEVQDTIKKKFLQSVDTYEQLRKIRLKAIADAGGGLTLTEPDDFEKQVIYGQTTTYLLAETNTHDALPLMAKAYSSGRRLPMSRLFLFYAMHLLVLDHPRNQLSATSRTALEDYLQAAKAVPPPSLTAVTAWNSSIEETDFRITILHTDIGVKRQPQMVLRVYPRELHEWEVAWTGDLSPEVHSLYSKLAAFIAAAYPDK